MFKLQKELTKTEMVLKEVFADNCREREIEWLDYVKNNVLCTVLSKSGFSKAMEGITGFGMKDCVSLPKLGWKNFKSLRKDEDEVIYTYDDNYMKRFLRQNIKGGRVCSYIQFFNWKLCDKILNCVSEDLKVNGIVYEFIAKYVIYEKKYSKVSWNNLKTFWKIVEILI